MAYSSLLFYIVLHVGLTIMWAEWTGKAIAVALRTHRRELAICYVVLSTVMPLVLLWTWIDLLQGIFADDYQQYILSVIATTVIIGYVCTRLLIARTIIWRNKI